MLIEKGADINDKEKDDWTPLHLAARESHFEIVHLLIEKEASVNDKENDGLTHFIGLQKG